MLKHRDPDRIHPKEQPAKPSMKNVVELPKPSEAGVDTGRFLEEAAIIIADQYGQIDSIQENAMLNDVVLRAAMKLPLSIQENGASFRDFLARMAARTNERLGKRGVSPEDRAEFAERMRTLESSVFQLAKVVRQGRAKNSEWRYATSVWMDVLYGIDLMRAWPVWVPEKHRLDVFVTAYQAKASRKGLDSDEVRDLARRYQGQIGRTQRELAFDPEWISGAVSREMDPVTVKNYHVAMAEARNARELLKELAKDGPTAYEKYRAEWIRAQLIKKFSDSFSLERPVDPVIAQRGELSFRFLVDTTKGLEDLTAEQVLNYGKAAPIAA